MPKKFYKAYTRVGTCRVEQVWSCNTIRKIMNDATNSHYDGIILLDVDGTIRNGAHRVWLLPDKAAIEAAGDRPNIAFQEFNELCHRDTPIREVIDSVNAMVAGGRYYVMVLTSCTASEHTIRTLANQLFNYRIEWDSMFIRDEENHRFPVEMKEHFIKAMGLDKVTNVIALDDCYKNCTMFRNHGITAFQVADYTINK